MGSLKIFPFKRQLFSAVKVVSTPGKGIRRDLKFNGPFTVETNSVKFKMMNYDHPLHILENDIFWLGLDVWEPVTSTLWIKLCKQSDVIMDIGANIGIFSLLAAATNPNSKIFGFEPIERTFNKYKKNILINKFGAITAENIELSDSDGVADMYDFPDYTPLNATLTNVWHESDSGRKVIKIKTRRLDSYIADLKLNKIDLIKIDVELHEPEVLYGMGKYLAEFQPTIVIEITTEIMWNRIMERFNKLDYLYFYIDELESKTLRKINSYEKFDGYNFLFCKSAVAKSLGII